MRVTPKAIPLFLIILLVSACTPPENPVWPAIDQIFADYDDTESAGCVCAVMEGGRVTFARGYGMANLETGTPLTPESVIYIASASKQFTAAAVALLAVEGRIDLEDDIRTVIPEFPDLGATITVRHLVHHTSGIRDYFGLYSLAGKSDREYTNNQLILDLLYRQRGLNFEPGDRYLYSNSNYILLAEIVRRVTGQTLNQFTLKRIFEPLGMKSSHFDDNYREIVPHRAASYGLANEQPFRFVKAFDAVGDGNLLTSVVDLQRWDENFYSPTVGGQELLDLILTVGQLNNGEKLDYAFGLIHGQRRGLETVSHGGAFKGFRTQLVRFPEQHFSVAVLCNLANTNPTSLANRVADLYLEGKYPEPPAEIRDRAAPTSVTTVQLEPDQLAALSGSYRRDDGSVLSLRVNDGRLTVSGFSLRAVSEERLVAPAFDVVLDFKRDSGNQVTGAVLNQGGSESRLTRILPTSWTSDQLSALAGNYYSPELEAAYALLTVDNQLFAEHKSHGRILLEPLGPDEFASSHSALPQVQFQRRANRIVGFTVRAGRVQRLLFDRQGGQ